MHTIEGNAAEIAPGFWGRWCGLDLAGCDPSAITDALRIAQEEEFDILLSDIGLPDGSGLELLRRIRETRPVPALALSGFGMDEDVQRSQDAGFFDHLIKPVSLDRLQAAIAELDAQAG